MLKKTTFLALLITIKIPNDNSISAEIKATISI